MGANGNTHTHTLFPPSSLSFQQLVSNSVSHGRLKVKVNFIACLSPRLCFACDCEGCETENVVTVTVLYQ